MIGDTALATAADGHPLPGVAPAAKQAGEYVARTDPRAPRRRARARTVPLPRSRQSRDYRAQRGGRGSRPLRLSGWIAWLLWGVVHIYFLIGFRNRVAVLMDWLWAYLTFQRGARLITGPTP